MFELKKKKFLPKGFSLQFNAVFNPESFSNLNFAVCKVVNIHQFQVQLTWLKNY